MTKTLRHWLRNAAILSLAFVLTFSHPVRVHAATQTLTVVADSTTESSGWLAEGGDCTRLQSDDGDPPTGTRLYTPTNNDTHFCTATDTSGLAGVTINSFTEFARCRSLDPVSNTFQLGVKISGTDYWSTNFDTNPSTSYILFSKTWTTSPATGSAWTTSELDAVEMGLKKTNTVGMGCTYMYGEVDYSAAAPAPATTSTPIAPGPTFSDGVLTF